MLLQMRETIVIEVIETVATTIEQDTEQVAERLQADIQKIDISLKTTTTIEEVGITVEETVDSRQKLG